MWISLFGGHHSTYYIALGPLEGMQFHEHLDFNTMIFILKCLTSSSDTVREQLCLTLSKFVAMCWRRKWQPTPVFLPREVRGQRSLVGCRLWGHTELDMTEAT